MHTTYELDDVGLRFIVSSKDPENVVVSFKIPKSDMRVGASVKTDELIEILEKLQTKPSKITVPADWATIPYQTPPCYTTACSTKTMEDDLK